MKYVFLFLIAFAFQSSLCDNGDSILFKVFDHKNLWIRDGQKWSGKYTKCLTDESIKDISQNSNLGQIEVLYENDTGLKTYSTKKFNLRQNQEEQGVQDDIIMVER